MATVDELLLRVQQLERSNKRLRCFLATLALAGGTVVLMGTAAPQHSVPPVIEAQQFVLKDAAGHERGSLFANDQVWGLVLYNRDSSKAAALAVTEGSNAVLLNDGQGKSGIAAYAKSDESNLAMFDAKGHARIELKNSPKGSVLGLRDDNGTDRVDVAFAAPDGGGVVINDANSTTRTLLGEREPGIATFNPKGSFLWAAGLDSFDKDSQKRIREAAEALTKAK